MTDSPGYSSYSTDERHMARYRDYQARYASRVRESDRVLIEWLREALPSANADLLDVGCSTGNLLVHLRHELPELRLSGIDLSAETIEANATNRDLSEIRFETADIVRAGIDGAFDVITCNAIFFALDDEELGAALRNLRQALRPGGQLFAFDWFHEHDDQQLTIVERSREFPAGLRITARPENQMRALMESTGFESVEFRPFTMPFDLPRPEDPSDVTSYTVAAADSGRLTFRGALFQPWSHMRGQVA
jgi:SAM-dependent methyltransferase